jgi:hypothetical protein
MARRLRVAGGKVAVWDGEGDTLPFDNPLGNLSRVKFHSDLSYIKVILEQTVTVNLPAIANVLQGTASYTLFAHGQAGFPFVLGKLDSVDGSPTLFTGSVPVQFGTGGAIGFGYYGRWVSLGADATNVYLHEYYVCTGFSGGAPLTYETYPALALPVTVYVTDEILE